MKLILNRQEVDTAVRVYFHLPADAIIETDDTLADMLHKFASTIDSLSSNITFFSPKDFQEFWIKIREYIKKNNALPAEVYYRNNTLILRP